MRDGVGDGVRDVVAGVAACRVGRGVVEGLIRTCRVFAGVGHAIARRDDRQAWDVEWLAARHADERGVVAGAVAETAKLSGRAWQIPTTERLALGHVGQHAK